MFILVIKDKELKIDFTLSLKNNKTTKADSLQSIKQLEEELKDKSPDQALGHYKKGDINGDGEVNQEDIKLLKEYLEGKKDLSEEELKRADMDNDGKVDSQDLRQLLYRFDERRNTQDKVTQLRQLYSSLSTLSEHTPDYDISKVDSSKLSDVKEELQKAEAYLQGLNSII